MVAFTILNLCLITYYFFSFYLLFSHPHLCPLIDFLICLSLSSFFFWFPSSFAFILYPFIRILKAYWIRPLALLIIPAPVLKTSPKPWPLCPPSLLHLLLCRRPSQKPGRRRPTGIIAEESRPLHNPLTKSTYPPPGPKHFRSLRRKEKRFKIKKRTSQHESPASSPVRKETDNSLQANCKFRGHETLLDLSELPGLLEHYGDNKKKSQLFWRLLENLPVRCFHIECQMYERSCSAIWGMIWICRHRHLLELSKLFFEVFIDMDNQIKRIAFDVRRSHNTRHDTTNAEKYAHWINGVTSEASNRLCQSIL